MKTICYLQLVYVFLVSYLNFNVIATDNLLVNRSKYMEDTYVAVISWHGAKYPLVQTILRFAKALNLKWKFQVFHGKSFSSEQLLSDLRQLKLNHTVFASIMQSPYNHMLLKDKSFWESLPGNHILLFQVDSAICSGSPYSLDDFIQYYIIGAPVAYKKGFVGANAEESSFVAINGGFSLRSKWLMLECISQCTRDREKNILDKHRCENNEDLAFSYRATDLKTLGHDINLPNITICSQFSTETRYFKRNNTFLNYKSFGIHNTWVHATIDRWNEILKFCPEAAIAKGLHQWKEHTDKNTTIL